MKKVAISPTCRLVQEHRDGACGCVSLMDGVSPLAIPRVLNHSAPPFAGRHSSSSRVAVTCSQGTGQSLLVISSKESNVSVRRNKFSAETRTHTCRCPSSSFVSALDSMMSTISIESFTKTSIHSFSSPASIQAKSLGHHPASSTAGAQPKATHFPSMKNTGKSGNLTRLS